ncbi:MAG: ornithine carbamoyltransferase [Deltaproteobacteria bacterium]|nr:ornithine carbamoyltransferase [Deltaproteobacteria bacterium]
MPDQPVRHLIHWNDFSDEEIKRILLLSKKIKQYPLDYQDHLRNQSLVMLFQKTSTRTRVSFEVAISELGGHGIFLDWNSTNFDLTEIGYEAAYLSSNCQVLMARMVKHEELLELAEHSSVPVINGCCNRYHPCQAMADMLTIFEHVGKTEGVKLTYIGVHNNVVNSLMALSAALGVHLTLVCPLSPEGVVETNAKEKLKQRGLLFETLDLVEAVKESDFIYTDTWVDMELFNDPKAKELKRERIELMMPYQLNEKLKEHTGAKIMHDMPIHPGYEISKGLVFHPDSIIFDQAENRLYTQKAILLFLLNKG